MKSKCPLVIVEWWDSAQPTPAWCYLADVGTEAIKCASVGWLVVDNADCKGVAPNMGAINQPDSLQISGLITIPTKSVVKIWRLKEPIVSGS